MKFVRFILLMLLAAGSALAAVVIDSMVINGEPYQSVTFGPVNQGKVVVYHSRGVTTVPISSLPAEYQEKFKAQAAAAPAPAKEDTGFLPVPRELPPTPTAPPTVLVTPRPPTSSLPSTPTSKRMEIASNSTGKGDWADYNHDRTHRVLFDGKLVEKSTLTLLVGFLAKERATITDDNQHTFNGAALDLAERKNGTEGVPSSMELRPALWRRTDERIFLMNYKPTTIPGVLMIAYGNEVEQIAGWRTFKMATEPTFEEWKRLAR